MNTERTDVKELRSTRSDAEPGGHRQLRSLSLTAAPNAKGMGADRNVRAPGSLEEGGSFMMGIAGCARCGRIVSNGRSSDAALEYCRCKAIGRANDCGSRLRNC